MSGKMASSRDGRGILIFMTKRISANYMTKERDAVISPATYCMARRTKNKKNSYSKVQWLV